LYCSSRKSSWSELDNIPWHFSSTVIMIFYRRRTCSWLSDCHRQLVPGSLTGTFKKKSLLSEVNMDWESKWEPQNSVVQTIQQLWTTIDALFQSIWIETITQQLIYRCSIRRRACPMPEQWVPALTSLASALTPCNRGLFYPHFRRGLLITGAPYQNSMGCTSVVYYSVFDYRRAAQPICAGCACEQ
jgi:hypothetical protein